VAEIVRSGAGIDGGGLAVFIEEFFDTVYTKTGTVFVQEKGSGGRGGAVGGKSGANPEPESELLRDDGGGDEQETFFVAFAVNEDGVVFWNIVLQIECLDFADS